MPAEAARRLGERGGRRQRQPETRDGEDRDGDGGQQDLLAVRRHLHPAGRPDCARCHPVLLVLAATLFVF